MSWHRRASRTPGLLKLYVEGCYAARHDRKNPYDPERDHGDGIRSWLWNHGYEDEKELMGMEELVGVSLDEPINLP